MRAAACLALLALGVDAFAPSASGALTLRPGVRETDRLFLGTDPHVLDLDAPLDDGITSLLLLENAVSGNTGLKCCKSSRPFSLEAEFLVSPTDPGELFLRRSVASQEEMSDEEQQETKRWIAEMQAIIEHQQGCAIWADADTEHLKRGYKQALAAQTLRIPTSVAKLIVDIHLERSVTLVEVLADGARCAVASDMRRWLAEQRRRMQRDPLPAVKSHVAKGWVSSPPHRCTRGRANVDAELCLGARDESTTSPVVAVEEFEHQLEGLVEVDQEQLPRKEISSGALGAHVIYAVGGEGMVVANTRGDFRVVL